MTAASADRKVTNTGIRRTSRGYLAAATIIYVGTLVARNYAGNFVPASDTAGLEVVGVALETVDNSAGLANAKTIQIGTGVFEFVNLAGAIALASTHALCYVGDDQSVTTAAAVTHDVIAGLVVGYTTTTVLVDVDPIYGTAIESVGEQDLSGAGAIDPTKSLIRFTSTGAGQALTLADWTGRGNPEFTILHVVDGGSGVLTAGGALHLTTGVATITLTNRWEWVRLRWTGALYDIVGCSPVAIVA